MWTNLPIIGFDTETTGVDSGKDRLVTCSLVKVTAGEIERMYWLADPGVEIPEQAASVHGITTEQAQAEGRPITEVLTEISDILVDHLASGHPAVAFNASYDFTLLEHELIRHGLPGIAQRLGGKIFPVVDPYLLDRSIDQFRRGKRRLEDLCAVYAVGEADSFHNAEADVLATLRVLAAMVRKHQVLAHETFEEIESRQVTANRKFVEYLNKRFESEGRELLPLPEAWPLNTIPPAQ